MTSYTFRDFDCCECGDYRHQHAKGSGPCKLGTLCTPGRCQKFRLSREATEIPASYAKRQFSGEVNHTTPSRKELGE